MSSLSDTVDKVTASGGMDGEISLELRLELENNLQPKSCNSVGETSSASKEMTYSKRPGTTGIRGQLYETKLLSLVLFHGLHSDHIQNFHLATNVAEAGAFDDIVMQCTDMNGKQKWTFLQAKHREGEVIKTIDFKDALTSENGDFCLLKYFKSFLTVMENMHNGRFAPQQNNSMPSDVEFIIFTNTKFLGESYDHWEIKLNSKELEENALLYTSPDKKIYYLDGSLDKIASNYYNEILAEIFAKLYLHNKQSKSIDDFIISFLNDYDTCSLKLLMSLFKLDLKVDKDKFKTTKKKIFDHNKFKTTKKEVLESLQNLENPKFEKAILTEQDRNFLIDKFYKKIFFYTDQPNESEIENIVKSKICSKIDNDLHFNIFHAAVQKWWLKTGNYVPWQTKASELFKNAEDVLIKIPRLKILHDVSMTNLESFDIKFDGQVDETLKKEIDAVFDSSENKTLNIVSNNHLLSCMKLVQNLSTQHKNFVYIVTSILAIGRLANEDLSNVNCLVFSCKKIFDDMPFQTVLKKVKKIVLITETACIGKFSTVYDKNNGLIDLCSESQEIMLSMEVTFQGMSVSLRKLIGENLNIVDESTLHKLMVGATVEVAPSIQSEIYGNDMKFYVERKLLRCAIDSKILSDELFTIVSKNQILSFPDNDKDIVVVGKLKNKNDFQSKDKKFSVQLSNEEAHRYFIEICQKYPNRRVHLLQQVVASVKNDKIENYSSTDLDLDFQLIWEKSYKSIENIHKFTYERGIDFEALSLTDIDAKFVLLAAEPGMGKSTFLTALTAKTKESLPHMFIIRMNLLDHSATFEDWQTRNISIDENLANMFLKKVVFKDVEATSFEKRYFDWQSQNKKSLLLIDGFDEISPDYYKVVSELVKILMNNYIGKIWVATRSGSTQKKLEQDFSTLRFALKPFNKENIEDFLHKNQLDKAYVSLFIENFNKNIKTSKAFKNDFLQVPLHLKMITDVQQHFNRTEDENWLFNIADLYEQFVELVFKRLYSIKNQIDPAKPFNKKLLSDNRQIFLTKHKLLAIHSMFGTKCPNWLLSDQEKKDIENYTNEVSSGQEKTGLIYKLVDNKPLFIHLTYAEYFAALHILDKYSQHECKSTEFRDFASTFDLEKLTGHGCEQICQFFSLLLKQNKTIKIIEQNVKAEYLFKNMINNEGPVTKCYFSVLLQLVDFSIEKNCDTFQIKIMFQEASEFNKAYNFTIACKMGCLNLLQVFIDNYSDSVKSNAYLSLHTATYHGHVKIVDLLLSTGAPINAKAFFHDKTYEESILEISEIPSAKNGLTALYMAAEVGHVEIVDRLLKKGADVNTVATYDGRTPLIVASQNGHTEVVKLLLEYGANINARSTDIGLTVLYMASENGHIEKVDRLLKKGADVNTVATYDGRTPLIVASQNGHTEVVKLLLEYGANINARSTDIGITALYMAAHNGHIEIVDRLLRKGADVNTVATYDGRTPLIVASQNGHTEVVKLLLEYRANINARSTDIGITALYMAAHNGHVEIVDRLLKKGADVNISKRDIPGWTPLICASQEGHTEVVKLLLEYGANINARSTDIDLTALYIAAENGQVEIVDRLLKKGADVNIAKRDIHGWTPLICASQEGHTEVVKLLLEYEANINARSTDIGITALYMAAHNGHVEIVDRLLKKGADVNISKRVIPGWTPLICASQEGHTEVVKLLLEYGANINARSTDSGITALFMATHNGHVEIVDRLLKKGADVNIPKINGQTPLIQASQNGHTEVVKLLLENGASTNAHSTNMGITALFMAAHNGHVEIVDRLLKKGDDVNTVATYDGRTPLIVASQNGHTEVVKLLLEYGANINAHSNFGNVTALYMAAHNGHVEIVDRLLKKGAHVNIAKRDIHGWTPLIQASQEGHTEVVKLLLEYGANINARSTDIGITALHMAAQKGHVETVDLLLKKGADVNIAATNNGRTPLIQASQNGHTEVVKLLLEYGANINARSTDIGITALMIAAYNGHVDVVNLLVANGANITITSYNGNSALQWASANGHKNVADLLQALPDA